jgi:phosphate-selective porin OprO/OprP
MWNYKTPRTLSAIITLALVTGLATQAGASDAEEIKLLREQLQLLEQKILVLERKEELKEVAAVETAKSAPKITASDGRIEIASADGSNSLRLRGLVQADHRLFDSANDPNDTFILRRARLIFEGKFARHFSYLIQPELAGTIQILDAYVNAGISPAINVRVGKFKTPIGLEQLQSDAVAFFNERSVATNLVPNRDVGITLHGDLFDERVNYTLGVMNGVPDGGNSVTGGSDFDDHKTIVARVFATPFANDKESPLAGLGLGIAASVGDYDTAAGRTSGYRTDGQQTFFAYDSSVVADGRSVTWSPHAYYYNGPFGLLAEYVESQIDVRRGEGPVVRVANRGYNLTLGWVLTGEDSSDRGVTPRASFSPSSGTWGAFEIVGRFAGVDIDDSVFAGDSTSWLANPNVSATKVTTFGLGLNWYLSRAFRVGLNFFHNEFDLAPGASPSAGSLISDDEDTFITRFQISF